MSLVEELPEATRTKVKETIYKYPQAWKVGICAFQMFNRDTGANVGRNSMSGDACHASISYGGRTDFVVVNAHKAEWQHKNKEFLLWVTQESPLAYGVLNRDNEDEILNHASVMDSTLVGSAGVLWLCKALRHFQEEHHKLPFWTKLREGGLDGLQAFVGADILQHNGKPQYNLAHTSLFHYTSPQGLREMYDKIKKGEKMTGSQAQLSKSAAGYKAYEGVCKSWGGLGIREVKKSDGWGGFIVKEEPCDVKEYVAALKEIFEGDPSNVKCN